MATSQAKRAIDKLRKAGLKRNQFQVRTERKYAGKRPDGRNGYEYGDVNITLLGIPSEFVPYAKDLAKAGLHVEIWISANTKTLYITDDKEGLWEVDWTNCDEVYGLPARKRII